MKFASYITPILLILLILYALIKKINIYQSFTSGVKKSIPLVLSLFPVIVAVFLMLEVFKVSGLEEKFISFLSPIFEFFGLPKEVIKLVIIKPFSGSGSLSILSEIYQKYGTSGYIPILASSIYGSSETIFYISAVYYVNCKNKQATKPIIISLVACFISSCISSIILRLIY